MATAMTLEQQVGLLKRWFPKVKPSYGTFAELPAVRFYLTLRPTPTSAAYKVLFIYSIGMRPLVFVVDPVPLREVNGTPTPHLNGDGTLCLFDPTKHEWSPSDPLVYTTVQWTVRWLYHYEHWVTFGEWRGDEESPAAMLAETAGKDDGAKP